MCTQSDKKIHYAWFVLLGCCMMQGISLGAVTNVCGVYYVPVCRDLGFATSELSFYRSIACLVALFGMSVFTRLIRTYNSRAVLTGGVLMLALPTLAMGSFNHLWQWYVFGAVQGFAANFITIVAAPLILSNWFHKKAGFAIGLSTASSGFAAAFFNYLLSHIIAQWGWRTAYYLNGAVALLLVLPATLLLIRYHPSEMGLTAYGVEEPGSRAANSAKSPQLSGSDDRNNVPLLMLCSVCIAIPAGFVSFFNAFGLSVGMSIKSAAVLASLAMLGNSVGKLLLGEMNDHLGTRIPTLTAYAVSIIGGIGLMVTDVPLIYLAGPMFGFSMPLYTTLMPLVTKAVVSEEAYPSVYSRVAMLMSLTVAVVTTLHGWLFDTTRSYTASVVISVLTLAVGLAVSSRLLQKKRTSCGVLLNKAV